MRIAVLIFIGILFFSCKKKEEETVDPNGPSAPAELSSPNFETEYGNCFDYVDITNNPLTALASNNIIVSSIQYDGVTDKLQITKLNSSGSLIWQKNITQGYKYMSGNCFETNLGELIALGASISQSSWVKSKTYIAKLNPLNGDTIWTRTYGHNYIDRGVIGCEDLSGNYWIVDFSHQDTKATLLKIAPNGDSLSSIINTEANPPTYEDAMITNNKSIILTGESGNIISGKKPVYMCRYSNSGMKDFSSHIELTNFDLVKINDVCETADGAYVVVGECYNFANTSLRYGFLLKVDGNGNKVWEKILTQFNGSAVYSCIEKQADVFYLGIGSSGNGKLYKYDLSNLIVINSSLASTFNDIQLLRKGNQLYRALIEIKPSAYETVKLKSYTIN